MSNRGGRPSTGTKKGNGTPSVRQLTPREEAWAWKEYLTRKAACLRQGVALEAELLANIRREIGSAPPGAFAEEEGTREIPPPFRRYEQYTSPTTDL